MLDNYNNIISCQVDPTHYDFESYVSPERWNSYWHQVVEVLRDKPVSVLIVGVGDNIVPTILKLNGIDVKTFDFDPKLCSDLVGDVRDISSIVSDKSFDVVMCCQVLEHIGFEYFETTIIKLVNVARKKLIVSLPYNHRRLFYLSMKLPKIYPIKIEIDIPSFWEKWKFNGEHVWEVGTKGYQKKRIDSIISNIVPRLTCYFAAAFKYHLFYVIDCTGKR
jgi:hypothetical protein